VGESDSCTKGSSYSPRRAGDSCCATAADARKNLNFMACCVSNYEDDFMGGVQMSVVLILTPLVISSWPAITAAAAGAAVALGLTVKHAAAAEEVGLQVGNVEVRNSAEVEMENSEVLQNVATDEELVLTKGAVEVRVKRDNRGRCTVCATGIGKTKAELHALAEEFSQKLTQCFVYNRVMTELKAKGFQVTNEQRLQDDSVNIHVRRWEE
jgi:hypothetical protein